MPDHADPRTENVPLLGGPNDQFAQELNPVDKVVTYFGYWLLALVTLVMLATIIQWCFSPAPSLPATADKNAIDVAKALNDMQWDRVSKLFDLLVLKAILPSFATVLGYLIGKKANG